MPFKNFIIFLKILFYICSKNIVLPFKKITIEDFNGTNTINDLITFHIYTNLSIGTPPQIVAHFIEQNDYTFHFQTKILSKNYQKSNKFQKDFYNLKNFWFNSKNSSTFILNDNNGFSSDVYYFNTLNNTKIKIDKLRYNIYLSDMRDKYKCGIIGLNPISFGNSKLNNIHISFLEELKEKELISEYSFTIFYEKDNNLLNYKKDLYLGKIIIGESPYIFSPDKYKKEEEIVNLEKDWSILVNELKSYSPKYNYTEENIQMQISLITGFIKGSVQYKKEIDKKFFSELIKNKLCNVELLSENVFKNEYYIYSCENNKEVKEYVKFFPSLYFEIKSNNLTFIFTYNDLFKVFNDRLYFMIIFRDEKYSYVPRWIMGDIFLRKYITTYNYDAKTFIFYKNQIDEVNIKSKIIYIKNNNSKKKIIISKYIRTLFEILMGLIIIIILYLFYRKFINTRKIHANELEDSNYIYVPHENKSSIKLKKEKELNKIIN